VRFATPSGDIRFRCCELYSIRSCPGRQLPSREENALVDGYQTANDITCRGQTLGLDCGASGVESPPESMCVREEIDTAHVLQPDSGRRFSVSSARMFFNTTIKSGKGHYLFGTCF